MAYQAAALTRLVEQFERLPGIGRKTAQRLAFFMLDQPRARVEEFAAALLEGHEKLRPCPVCCNLTDGGLCSVCADEGRDRTTICVVAETKDVIAFERTREYKGLYHVLHGVLSPLDGVGPEQLRVKELLARLDGNVREVIMATNPTVEGEATAMYIARLVQPLGVKVTRLAYGIPMGGEVEYADEVTLYRALEGRREIG